jgi:RecA-family ATPase
MDRSRSPEDILEDAGVEQLPKHGSKRTGRFTLTRFADIKPLEGEDYCVKGFLPRSGLAVVWGPPKCGKSFWVFDLLMHVALGWRYRGRRVRQGPVVYVCLEGAQGFRKRAEAFRQAKLANREDDPPFFLTTAPLSLAADHQGLIADIKRQIGKGVPATVCIDTLNRSLAGSESSDEDMAAYIRAADAIRDAFGMPRRHHPPLRPQRRASAGAQLAHGRPRRPDRRATRRRRQCRR